MGIFRKLMQKCDFPAAIRTSNDDNVIILKAIFGGVGNSKFRCNSKKVLERISSLISFQRLSTAHLFQQFSRHAGANVIISKKYFFFKKDI
jgi:hypothetical protein